MTTRGRELRQRRKQGHGVERDLPSLKNRLIVETIVCRTGDKSVISSYPVSSRGGRARAGKLIQEEAFLEVRCGVGDQRSDRSHYQPFLHRKGR